MFAPKIEDGRMYGRGTLDMKSFAAVAMNSMHYVLTCRRLSSALFYLPTKNKAAKARTRLWRRYPELNVGVVLDNDVGGDIGVIINKCKNPVFVRLTAGRRSGARVDAVDGLDANEMLMRTIAGLRRFYPYFDINSGKPANTWIDTMRARISGDVSNIISGRAEALLDIRLTETSTVEDLAKNLREAYAPGVSYEIVSASTPVVMSEDNPQIWLIKGWQNR